MMKKIMMKKIMMKKMIKKYQVQILKKSNDIYLNMAVYISVEILLYP
jgi:hypothetical protein